MIGRGLRVATYAFTQPLALGEAARLELEAAFIEAYERPALESHIARSLPSHAGRCWFERSVRSSSGLASQIRPTPPRQS